MFSLLALSLTLSAAPDAEKSAEAVKALTSALTSNPTDLLPLAEKDFARVPLTKGDAVKARQILWAAHVAARKVDRADELKAKTVTFEKHEMPYDYTQFGKPLAGGASLWISMHGGGNAPKNVNDQQWDNQKKLGERYGTIREGYYVAPRAPTNTWNLWHEQHIDPLFTRLIENFVAVNGVNPDKVYLMGYSAGGDGVYQLAPRMADQLAGASMMAGHPNGVSLLGLRNLPFALQVGGNDSAYSRNKVAKEYGQKLDELEKADPKGYPHFVKIHEGKGHWMGLDDKVALPWLAKYERNTLPEKIVWKQTGPLRDRFYWIAVPTGKATNDALAIVSRSGNTVTVTSAEKIEKLVIRLDDRIQDLDKPIVVKQGDKELYSGPVSRTAATLIRTLAGRGDNKMMFDAEITVELR